MRAKIVYYSRKGSTKKAGQIIGKELASHGITVDYEEIEPLREEGYIKSLFMAVFKREVPILNANLDVGSYDIIFIGSPIWACSAAPPVNSYMMDVEGLMGKKVAVFASMYRAGGALAVKCMLGTARKKGAAAEEGICFSREECANDTMMKLKIKEFIKPLIL
jgi:flavodoxin